MAKIDEMILRDWQDRDTMTAYELKREREILRTAINDNFSRILGMPADHYDKETIDTLLDELKGNGYTNESIMSVKNMFDGLQTQIDNLNQTYSTDAERIQAINDVINQFEIADNDLESLILSKANKADVYTKTESNNKYYEKTVVDNKVWGTKNYGDRTVTKEKLSTTLTSEINTAIDNADTEAQYAHVQGDYAKTQGNYAKTQGDYAKTEVGKVASSLDQMTDAISEAETATVNADNAALNANTKANTADLAATNANTRANEADLAATNAEQAATNANTKATLANTKAQLAQEKADYAEIQGNYAKTQGNYAKAQGERAEGEVGNLTTLKNEVETATTEANTAAQLANSEAANLNTLKTAVQTATNEANTATINANTKATEAETQGNYAKAQGDYAKTQAGLIQDILDDGSVASVNGQNGVVVLDADDVGAIPATEKGVSGGVATLNTQGKVVDANGNEVEGKVTSVNGQIGDVLVKGFSGDYNDLTNQPTIPDISGKADRTELHEHSNKSVLDATSASYTTAEKTKLNGIETGANNYTHPSSHPASMITESTTKRFVSDTQIADWNEKETPTGAQTKATKALNDAKGYTDTKVASIVNSAPETLDTLNELANALGNDANFSTTIANQIGAKYSKPSVGIPKTDLDSSVQSSLTKADSAIQSIPNGTTGQKGIVQLSTSTSSTSTSLAATPSAVKNAYDKAVSAETKANQVDSKADATGIKDNGAAGGTSFIIEDSDATKRSAIFLKNNLGNRAGFFFYGSEYSGYANKFRIHLDKSEEILFTNVTDLSIGGAKVLDGISKAESNAKSYTDTQLANFSPKVEAYKHVLVSQYDGQKGFDVADIFNPTTDTLIDVTQNGWGLSAEKYVIDNGNIYLIEGVSKGTQIAFTILKNVPLKEQQSQLIAGDLMAGYYGKTTGLITGNDLFAKTGLTAGTTLVSGDITWLKFSHNYKTLFVPNNDLKTDISWDEIQAQDLVKGKPIEIKGKYYICRLLTCSETNPTSSFVTSGEWNLVKNFVPSNSESNWAYRRIMFQEIYSGQITTRMSSHTSSLSQLMGNASNLKSSVCGYRPVLEVL
jgi:hypothetical protein